jgi:hypothetical protein
MKIQSGEDMRNRFARKIAVSVGTLGMAASLAVAASPGAQAAVGGGGGGGGWGIYGYYQTYNGCVAAGRYYIYEPGWWDDFICGESGEAPYPWGLYVHWTG